MAARVTGAGDVAPLARAATVAPAAPAPAARSVPALATAGAAARRARRLGWWTIVALVVLGGSLLVGVLVGPAHLPVRGLFGELLDRLPFVRVHSGLTPTQRGVLIDLRLPRVVLGALVGCTLSASGATFQGVFRNPLADPYLLGSAAGAGLGATLVIVYTHGRSHWAIDPLPLAAFVGALVAMLIAYALGAAADRSRSSASILLAGVAVASFFTAVQTYVQQRHSDVLREVYSWILGRLVSSGWGDVRLVFPYVAVTSAVLIAGRRHLDVMRVGDDEANAVGLNVRRARLVLVITASLGTAAVVAVSGLIGFVGIIVPHAVRLLTGSSYRRLLPLSMIFGAAFLVLADVAARTIQAPAELPIGVVTAFFGAPFFLVVLRTRRGLR